MAGIRIRGNWDDRSVDPTWYMVLGALSDGVISPEVARDWIFGRDGRSFRKLDGQVVTDLADCGCQQVTSASGGSGGSECCCRDEECDGRHEHKPAPWAELPNRGGGRLKREPADDRAPDVADVLRAAGYRVEVPEPRPAPGLPF